MKTRADIRLAQDGLTESRAKARRLILAGRVSAGSRTVSKPSEMISDTEEITIRSEEREMVGRGGLKLLKAIEVFDIPVEGRVFADIGASTGGFTDCLLQHGARLVYAVDVGHGQLHDRLRNDPRVRVMEGVNARALTAHDFDPRPQEAVMDVSFISIVKILPALRDILPEGTSLTALVKPQFEAGKGRLGKRGVIRDPRIHEEILEQVLVQSCDMGFEPMRLDFSPIRGQAGNIEFLLSANRTHENSLDLRHWKNIIRKVVISAHQSLK